MFLPLHDGVPLKNMKTPLATRCLIGVCVIAYLATFYGPLGEDAMVGGFGFIPSVLFGTEVLPEGYPFVPAELTLATASTHAGNNATANTTDLANNPAGINAGTARPPLG